AHLEQFLGVLLDDTGFEIGGADIEDATDDASWSENLRCLTIRANAILHRHDGGVRVQPGDRAAGLLDILRLDREQNDVGGIGQDGRCPQPYQARLIGFLDQEPVRLDGIDMGPSPNQADVRARLLEPRSHQAPDGAGAINHDLHPEATYRTDGPLLQDISARNLQTDGRQAGRMQRTHWHKTCYHVCSV